MKAVVLRRPRTLELMDIPEPKLLAENHVLIKVRACGICGSDLRYWAGENPWSLHTLGRHIDNPPDMVLGHEFAGDVVKVNSAKYEHLLGARVGVQAYRVCGECQFCKTGRENLCRSMLHIGHAQGWGKMDFYPGAYAEYCLGWADLLHRIPGHLSHAEAAMADILCVAIHVVGRTTIYQGSNVLCIGGGPAGLGIAQISRLRGARQVFISDPSPLARSVIGKLEDFVVIDPTTEDVAVTVTRHLGQAKCAAIFDSVGSQQTIGMGLPLLEELGTYVNMAVHSTQLNLNAMALGSERSITTSSNAFYRDVVEAFDCLNYSKIDVTPWITHRFPLEQFQTAFDLLLQSPKAAYKVVFEPWR
ncbi:alcohol dehydrogenase catalytic domain-containing protein [candidate division KSB1 bacterium]|nr:alcohol dehydrogenase catalytic domain-containing protein [candidate division KSB1 bacterium]